MRGKPLITLTEDLLNACRNSLVLTPNRRLKEALKFAYDVHHFEAGARTWPTARIQTLDEHLASTYQLLRERAPLESPRLLRADAERLVWWQCAPTVDGMQAQDLLSLVESGWRVLHGWQLASQLDDPGRPFDATDDTKLFARWAEQFRAQARRRWITNAEVPSRVAEAITAGALPAPDTLTRLAFDAPSPAHQRLLDVYAAAGCGITEIAQGDRLATPTITPCATPAHELNAAIRWARELAAAATGPITIGIVLPDLVDRHDQVTRMLAAELCPERPYADPIDEPFNVTGGVPLDQPRLINDALTLLRWLGQPLHHGVATRLLNSPFFDFATARPPSYLPTTFTLADLAAAVPTDARLTTVHQTLGTSLVGILPLASWVERFNAVLTAAGWPDTPSLTSESYQAWDTFQRLLEDLRGLDGITPAMTGTDALALLDSSAARRLFAAQRPHAPIQVLGYLECAGLRFDHLWVTGLTEATWPGVPRPNPMIPVGLQRHAGVPRSSQGLEWAYVERLTAGWRAATSNLVFSYPERVGEERQLPSPLLAGFRTRPASRTPATPSTLHPYAVGGGTALETVFDETGPTLDGAPASRGAGILRDQAACPFKAFARYRLKAEEPELPHSYPDLRERGIAVHKALEHAYRNIHSQADLAALTPQVRTELATSAATTGVLQSYRRNLSTAFKSQETERIAALIEQWFEVDLERPAFTVDHRESELERSFGSFAFKVRIDRIDTRPDGTHPLVIDYKTGRASVRSWQGVRPEEPQLPLYAQLVEATGVAFATVRDGESKLLGITGEHETTTDHVSLASADTLGARDFSELKDTWRKNLQRLVSEFMQGHAAVTPRHPRDCGQCHLAAVCRIREQS